ncbi:DUF3619 family protein [Ramlibacter sp. RBP-2]|uniref:DUF3619 family protein n=1 Tax=Ramlibacter lithotrophicus TaxID=2606681 RepID=A0A7X6DCW4_9BURK|nr:DUF3619 family protein [Ramlibacter lithotrophicus]NKE64857.1 DUF3619 family protein [Ramlibacter lithotrophicus]
MTKIESTVPGQLHEQFGRAVGRRLSAGTAELPYHVTERLRAARMQALASRKAEAAAPQVVPNGHAAALSLGKRGFGFWQQVGSVLPLVVLVGGLVLINNFMNDRRASEVAEVDAALLTDDLPPSAYADPGFVQFLKSGR